jgi:AcrR family transcriptional regulator
MAMRSDSIATTDELLDVAERLFAQHGVEQVALTRIVAASGQRNRSALHYHFGSRDGLVAAVLDRRIRSVNALRNAMLDDLPQPARLTEAVRMIIAPICLTMMNEPWGGSYISILAQVSFRPRLLGERIDEASLTSIRRCRRLIEQALPDIPPAVHRRRYRWLFDSVVLQVARWSREMRKTERTQKALEALIEEMVAYGAAALAAPLAKPTGNGRPARRR